ncbi:MAG TPA: NUDIX domain-containing protein [Devosiaceae bacterium]|nr:NUDIX domain-containing protein [Devosiaceae bacterium]
MTDAPRTMLSFVVGATRFNCRVAGIALRDGHVLTCREDEDDWVMLPGGRVEMGEPSPVALAREMAEELDCAAEIGPLAYTVENFFERAGQRFHEIGLYYRVILPDAFPYRPEGVCFDTEDEGHRLRFEWVAAEPAALRRINLKPTWLADRLAGLPAGAQQLVMHE